MSHYFLFSLSLSVCSDWSRTMTGGDHRKKNNLVNSDSVASDSTSAVRKVSDSSTGSAPNHHQRAWVGLWMCLSVKLFLSRSIVQSQTLILTWKDKINYIFRVRHSCTFFKNQPQKVNTALIVDTQYRR